jgi:ABC-type xylose transport system substrate-binding protein
MARLHHLVAISLLLLLPVLAAAAAAAEEPDIRISVQYPTEEEARWLDRWSEKYQAQGSGSGFSVHPATEEESEYLNSIFFDNGKKRAASGGHSHDGRPHRVRRR